jgi:chaperonin cofactor prefoldin
MSETKEVAVVRFTVEREDLDDGSINYHLWANNKWVVALNDSPDEVGGDARRYAYSIAEAAREIERLTAERERQWCLSCGTVTRDGTCDCTKTDNPQAQKLVNYADELSKDVSTLAGQVSTLTAERDALKEAVDHQAKALAQSFGAEKLGWVEKWKARAETAEATVSTLTRQLEEAREECAKVADGHAKARWGGPGEVNEAIKTVSESIAFSIRSLKQGERA